MAKSVPASIAHNNPGAMYPGKSSRKFGSQRTSILGTGHKMAMFPDKVSGAAAMFDLLARVYTGMTLKDAIAKWSGGNNVETYLKRIQGLAGVSRNTVLTRTFLEDESKAIPLAQAMAHHEAGRKFPMDIAEWTEAHARVFDQVSDPKVAGDPFELAGTFLGVREYPGAQRNNPIIMRWYVDAGHPQKNDEVPNCSAFVCSMLERTGHMNPKTLLARDHLEHHEECEPYVGCIVVLSRGRKDSWTGHVGFLAKPYTGGDTVVIRGANQGDEVNETAYPASRILGFRRPLPARKPVVRTIAESRSLQSIANSIFATVTGMFLTVWNYTTGLFSDVPVALDTAEQTVSTGQRAAALLNIGWPMALTASIAIACMIYAFSRGLSERRVENRRVVERRRSKR